ncbi:hypothetical protein AAY23_105775, partial [Frankia casuarinae]
MAVNDERVRRQVTRGGAHHLAKIGMLRQLAGQAKSVSHVECGSFFQQVIA